MSPFGIIIPARYASTRLPGKPLREIAGKPLIQWVYENARQAGAEFVWVATDDERIQRAVLAFGGEVVMTSPSHQTGTDRLAEVVKIREVPAATIIVNVQGDEPLLPLASIREVAQALVNQPEAGIATLAHPLTTTAELFNPNVVKVVLDARGFASYFSRAPIPWVRDAFSEAPPASLPEGVPFLRHVGLYAYRARCLEALSALPAASAEQAESLEQLRALHAGIKICVSLINEALPPGVDTEEDLRGVERALKTLDRRSSSSHPPR